MWQGKLQSDNLQDWNLLPKHPDWSKGFESDSLKTVSQVAADVFSPGIFRQWLTLSGPSFARELAGRHPTAVAAAFIAPDQGVGSAEDALAGAVVITTKRGAEVMTAILGPGYRVKAASTSRNRGTSRNVSLSVATSNPAARATYSM